MRTTSPSGAALFCRAFGVCIAGFGYATLPTYLAILDSTVLAFPYAPYHHLHLPPASPRLLKSVRNVLVACGMWLAVGVIPRFCLVVSFGLITYIAQLDRTFYNNHYYLLQLLCLSLLTVNDRCLSWPWRRTAPSIVRWQLTTLQCLVLTPYAYGALAKCNYSWLLHAQPVRAWADPMLGNLDTLLGGRLSAAVDSLPPQMNFDIVACFSYTVSYAGLAFDAWLPWALLCARATYTRAAAMAACVAFNAANKLFFGLGIFPWLNVCALALFASPQSTSAHAPPPSPQRAWPRALVAALSVVVMLVPLRGLVWFGYGRSGMWTDEGALYAWHMKLVEREGWVVLQVKGNAPPSSQAARTAARTAAASSASAASQTASQADDAPSRWYLVPETDTALHPDQAGELAHNPTMLLHYAEHLAALFRLGGVANVSVRAISSCVSANGRAAQPLFMSTANLLEHSAAYRSARAELSMASGVGTFLHPWHSGSYAAARLHMRVASPAHLCDLETPPPHQRESDDTYKWLYAPMYMRSTMADWPWRGRSRVPTAGEAEQRPHERCDAESGDEEVPFDDSGSSDAAGTEDKHAHEPDEPPRPAWARKCSYLHAAKSVWCPMDAVADVE